MLRVGSLIANIKYCFSWLRERWQAWREKHKKEIEKFGIYQFYAVFLGVITLVWAVFTYFVPTSTPTVSPSPIPTAVSQPQPPTPQPVSPQPAPKQDKAGSHSSDSPSNIPVQKKVDQTKRQNANPEPNRGTTPLRAQIAEFKMPENSNIVAPPPSITQRSEGEVIRKEPEPPQQIKKATEETKSALLAPPIRIKAGRAYTLKNGELMAVSVSPNIKDDLKSQILRCFDKQSDFDARRELVIIKADLPPRGSSGDCSDELSVVITYGVRLFGEKTSATQNSNVSSGVTCVNLSSASKEEAQERSVRNAVSDLKTQLDKLF